MAFNTIALIIVGIAGAIGIGSRFVFKKTDNIVEEASEVVIKEITNVDVDLSPLTPEDKEFFKKNDELYKFVMKEDPLQKD